MKLYWGSSCGDTGCRGRHFGGRSKGKYGSIGDWSKFSRFIKFEVGDGTWIKVWFSNCFALPGTWMRL